MRRFFWLALGILLLVLFYKADYFLLRLTDRLIAHGKAKIENHYSQAGIFAYWSFDEPVIINYVNQAMTGNKGVALVAGRFGKGRGFYGRPDNTLITDFDFRKLKLTYTFSFWIKASKQSERQTIISNSRGSIDFIGIDEGRLYFKILASPREDQVLSYPFNKYDEFVHIACTADFNKKEACIYENGVLKERLQIANIYHRLEGLMIGQYKGLGFPNYILDELILRNYAMSPEEILEESRSKRALLYRFKPFLSFEVKSLKIFRNLLQRGIKSLDLLNPFYHQSRILEAPLPNFHLYLSKKDIKAFNEYHHLSLEHGITPDKVSKSRRIQMDVNGKPQAASMELYGEAERLSPYGKKTFTIELEGQEQFMGMNRIVFVPPETNGLLRPLLKSSLEGKYRLPSFENGIGVVWINGEYQGLYYFENAGLFAYAGDYSEHWEIESFLKGLPASKKDILGEYDRLIRTYAPLFVRDRTSFLGSGEIFYRIQRDRKKIENMALQDFEKNDKNLVEVIKTFLNEKVILRDNPGRECILRDLDFSLKEMEGVSIRWESDRPDVVSDTGRVHRPQGDSPIKVTITAHLSRGPVENKKLLYFTVMPSSLKLNVLSVYTGGKIRAFVYRPCSVEFISEGKGIKSGILPSRIRLQGNSALHYPKRSYKIRLDVPQEILDFNPSSALILMASYKDLSFMRNHMAYGLFRDFSRPGHMERAPKHHLAELFINHEFQGIYEFFEDVGPEMLGLSNYQKNDSVHSVLYKAEGKGSSFSRVAPEYYLQQGPDVKYGEYWQPYVDLITFLGQAPKDVFRAEVGDILDIENVMHFHILLLLTGQMDGPDHNLFLARNNRPDDKFFIVPWDYDRSFGGPMGRIPMNHLFKRLMKELPGYNEALIDRWKELRQELVTETALMRKMDEIENKIRDRVAANFELWPISEEGSREVFVSEMRDWIKKRLVFLDQYIEKIGQAK